MKRKICIQIGGEETIFRIEIEDDAIVDDIRKAVFVECPDIVDSSRKLVVYKNKIAFETKMKMKEIEKVEEFGMTRRLSSFCCRFS